MDPASDRSYHPTSSSSDTPAAADSFLRSTFHNRNSPAAARSRSRGRGSHAEVKSPTNGSGGGGSGSASVGGNSRYGGGDAMSTSGASFRSRSSQRQRGGFNNNTSNSHNTNNSSNHNRVGNSNNNNSNPNHNRSSSSTSGNILSLSQHLHTQNTTQRSRRPYEMDIESFDKDQTPTWASRDWCAEARKSKAFLRGVDEEGDAANLNNGVENGIWNGREEKKAAPINNNSNSSSNKPRQYFDNDMTSTIFNSRWEEAVNDAAGVGGGGGTAGGRQFHAPQNNHREFNTTNNNNDSNNINNNGGGGFDRNDDTRSRRSCTSRGRPMGDDRRMGDDRSQYGGSRISISRGRPTAAAMGDDDRSQCGGNSRSIAAPSVVSDNRSRHSGGGDGSSRRGSSNGRPTHHQQQQQQQDGGYNNDDDEDVGSRRGSGAMSRNSSGRSLGPQEDGLHRIPRREQDPLARSNARSVRRASDVRQSQNQQQHQQQQQSQQMRQSRSQSRGPPTTRNNENNNLNPRSQTPGGPRPSPSIINSNPNSANNSRSNTPGPPPNNNNRPTKKVGCLGGSSDFTGRNRGSNGDLHQMNTNNNDQQQQQQQQQQHMKEYEAEMKHRRKHEPEERSGRSQSRGRNKSTSRHGGEARDPSCGKSVGRGGSGGRSKSRSRRRSSTPGPSNSARDVDDSGRSGRSRSRGRHSHSGPSGDATCDTRTTKSSKQSSHNSRHRSKSRSKKKSSKQSVASSSTSSTPETGPLSSYSGKSSKGNLLRKQISKLGSNNMPPSTPPTLDDIDNGNSSRCATPNRVPSVNGGADDSTCATPNTTATPGNDKEEEEIMTYLFDRKGYCVRHPNVRLRKKKLLGDWKVLIKNCPECCVEEMGRLKRVRSRRKKKMERGRSVGRSGSGKKEEKGDKKKGKIRVPSLGRRSRSRGTRPGVPRLGHSRSRSRARRPETKDSKISRHRSKSRNAGRSVSRHSRRHHRSKESSTTNNKKTGNDGSAPVFEFDISLDERGDVTNARSSGNDRSVKSRRSHKSMSSKKSGKSTRTNKTSRSTRTTRTSKSKTDGKTSRDRTRSRGRGAQADEKRERGTSRGTSRSRGRSGRSKSRDSRRSHRSARSKSRDAAGNETVVSRGSHKGSSQRFIRNGPHLRVAKMPFTDKYNREGKYTGEINEHGQPHGQGVIRYNNGIVYEGLWEDGISHDMDENMGRAKGNGFSNWKSNTQKARLERERKKEQDMDDLRSFISQSVRSGSVGGGGGGGGSLLSNGGRSQLNQGNERKQPSSSSSSRRRGQREQQGNIINPGDVQNMPWEDVNGFSGHYTGEVNSQNVPDGQGSMRYSNGVVEEGLFCNGVYQPPIADGPPQYDDDEPAVGVPSSSMSVWSLKSSPTMAFAQGGHNVLTGRGGGRGGGGGASSVIGAPTSVHLGGPSGGGLYGNVDRRY